MPNFQDILDIIEHLAVGGHGDKVEQLFPHLQKGLGYNQDVCNLVLKLLNKGQEETAKKIMKTMPKTATQEDTLFKGAFFIKQLFRLNRSAEQLLKSCKDLQQEGLVPNAVYIATENALQQGRTEVAQLLFKELEKEGREIRQHYYWPLLAQKGKEHDEEGLLQILRDMAGRGLMPTGEALRDYVIPYLLDKDNEENVILKLQIGNVPLIHGARNLIVELLEQGKINKAANIAIKYQPRGQYSLMSRPLQNALAKTKDINSFATILHVISSQGQTTQTEEDAANDDAQCDDKSNSNEVGRIVKNAVKILGRPDLCEQLLQAIHFKGLRISTEAAEAIQQHLGQDLTKDVSELLSKLTSSDLELAPLESPRRGVPVKNSAQLEHLLAQAKSKGSPNVNRLQRQLLTLYMNENNVEKLNSFLVELKSSNFELTPATLAQLYEFYCQNGDIDKANECEQQMYTKDPEFKLNKYKLILMANAFVQAKRYDEALEFLKSRKINSSNENNNFIFNSKCWQMLNSLAEDKQDVIVSIQML